MSSPGHPRGPWCVHAPGPRRRRGRRVGRSRATGAPRAPGRWCAGGRTARNQPGVRGAVGRLRDHAPDGQRKTIHSPAVGLVTLDCDVLATLDSDLRIIVYTARPHSEDASKLDLLRVTAETETPSRPSAAQGSA
ncbi:hypothetical protein [Nonomuraea sp. B1E8]|uniref:MmyB family transcriptional regulator n=1 Tax=unclassified Nonomuraea TaxID=2593643 RepID=UPI00325F3CBB